MKAKFFHAKTWVVSGIVGTALAIVQVAGATTDPNLTDTATSIEDYFSANIGVIIGVVVAISVFVWLLRVLFHSIGVRRVRSVD